MDATPISLNNSTSQSPHELLDELDVNECFTEPGKAPVQGEVLKKQEQIYRDLGVTPLLATPEIGK